MILLGVWGGPHLLVSVSVCKPHNREVSVCKCPWVSLGVVNGERFNGYLCVCTCAHVGHMAWTKDKVLKIFQLYQPEEGAKFFFVNLDHNIAGSVSPNNGEKRDSKKELHLDKVKDWSRRLALNQPFKPILTSVPWLALDWSTVKSLIFF